MQFLLFHIQKRFANVELARMLPVPEWCKNGRPFPSRLHDSRRPMPAVPKKFIAAGIRSPDDAAVQPAQYAPSGHGHVAGFFEYPAPFAVAIAWLCSQ
jgi:hypothetical protein